MLKVIFVSSVTRFGNLLHFGQLFKAWGNNYFAQIANFVRLSKSFIFPLESFGATFIDIWRLYIGHNGLILQRFQRKLYAFGSFRPPIILISVSCLNVNYMVKLFALPLKSQFDQIGLFLKGLGNKFSSKWSPIVWQLFLAISKTPLFKKKQ